MTFPAGNANWGETPWTIDFRAEKKAVPDAVEFAVIGGGFCGTAATAWLRRLAPDKSVALFEARGIGAGASGHTGGMALAETAAGDLAGLGDVLAGFSSILKTLAVDCDLSLPGVFEIGHEKGTADSPIAWTDSGPVSVTAEVPGGTIDPGKMVSGLARAAENAGALIFEQASVDRITPAAAHVVLSVLGQQVRASQVLMATNALSLELSGLVRHGQPKFTLATATEELSEQQIESLGLSSGKPFYTTDLPYLWGRRLHPNALIFGSGLVHLSDWRELFSLDITEGEAANLLSKLQGRVRGLHPALRDVKFVHRWGGPILVADHWQPVFQRHVENSRATVLGGFSGHGVALSVYLGSWAAEAMLGRKALPDWSSTKVED
jgi:gamma-glutamylputrescine oxidase